MSAAILTIQLSKNISRLAGPVRDKILAEFTNHISKCRQIKRFTLTFENDLTCLLINLPHCVVE